MSSPATTLILVRHSDPDADPAVPPPDWPLSAGGRTRARALAERLRPLSPDAIYSSPERKARETAGIGTVLVIDDEAAVRDLMQRFLTREGFRVVVAAGGDEGLRRARELRPDAITLDVMMPGMDGWAVLAALKAEPELADIPVIMLTIVDDRNLGYALSDFTTVNFDFLQHYRPRVNVLERPHARSGGKGYAITGHHEIMIPLLAAALAEASS